MYEGVFAPLRLSSASPRLSPATLCFLPSIIQPIEAHLSLPAQEGDSSDVGSAYQSFIHWEKRVELSRHRREERHRVQGKGSFLGMELKDEKRRNWVESKEGSGGLWHSLELEVGRGRAAHGGTAARLLQQQAFPWVVIPKFGCCRGNREGGKNRKENQILTS